METDSQVTKVIILDDHIFPTIDAFPINVSTVICDDTSKEFGITKKFIEDNGLQVNTSDPDELIEYITSNKFIEEVLFQPSFTDLFEPGFSTQVETLKELVTASLKPFKPFLDLFSDKAKFILDKSNERYTVSQLSEYDVIVMDLMMGDQYDNNFEGLARLLGDLHSDDKAPNIFLISSRPELNEQKQIFRKESQISSLKFSILTKTADLIEPSATLQIQLTYSQMLRAKQAAQAVRGLSKALEEAMSAATEELQTKLWSLDYPYLQQMYACTASENVPYADHLLEVMSKKLQSSLESAKSLLESADLLEGELKNNDRKFCSFSHESPYAMHDIEASFYFKGKVVDPNSINNSGLKPHGKCDLENEEKVVSIFPFGLTLIQKEKEDVSDGDKVLINCTQQCDLSRNVIRYGVNMLFVQGVISTSPRKGIFCVPYPIHLSGKQNRWWIALDDKKPITMPFYESVRYMNFQMYKPSAIVRDEVVRQIRERVFQNMSRTEESVKSGHNNLFYIELLEHAQEATKKFDSPVCLYTFPSGSNKSYHLLDQEHVEVISWLRNECPAVATKFTAEELETILKNELPGLDKQSDKRGIKFVLSHTKFREKEKCVTAKQTLAIRLTVVNN